MLFDECRKQFCISFFLLLSASGLFGISYGHAAVVTLTNGDQITGELQGLNDGVLALKSDALGEVKIAWDQVAKLVSDDNVDIQLQDGTGKVAETPASSTLLRQDILASDPVAVDSSMQYSGKVDLGGIFNRGNSREDQLHTSGEFIARTPEQRYAVNWEINEAKSAGIKTTSNRRLLGQYDRFLDPKNYLFVNAKAESDALADLTLRSGVGTGYGRQLIDTEVTKLSGEISLNYIRENYSITPDRSFPTMGLGFKYEQKFLNQKLVYFNNFNADANLSDTSDLLLRNRMGIRIPITAGINLSTQFNMDYDHQPALGKKKADTALILSLGYVY